MSRRDPEVPEPEPEDYGLSGAEWAMSRAEENRASRRLPGVGPCVRAGRAFMYASGSGGDAQDDVGRRS